MKDPADRRLDFLSERVGADLIIAGFLAAAHCTIVRLSGRGDWLGWLDASQRDAAFAASAAAISIIGGIATIALSLYQTSAGPRARAVREQFSTQLRRNWRAVLGGTGLAAALCVIAIVLDRPATQLASSGLFEFAFLVAALRFARLMWLFDRMLEILDRDLVEDVPIAEPPALRADWARHRAS